MKNEVSLTFYGGIGEIGGNKIKISDKNADIKFFLDFGKSFSIARKYYEFPFTYPETINELISINAIPPDKTIYTHINLKDLKSDNFSKDIEPNPSVDGIFISHAHLDHYGHISLLNRKIPIYVGECAKNIIDASARLIYRQASPEQIYNGLKLITFHSFKEIEMRGKKNSIFLKPIHVDHSIPGAYGVIVYTSKGVIAYTGDFRFHGPQKQLTEDFVRALEQEEIKVLITEGTHIQYSELSNEQEVKEKVQNVVDRTRNLVIADFSRSDLDRFATFYDVARETDRKLVIDFKRYLVLKAILKTRGILAKNVSMESETVLILDEEKKKPTPIERNVLASLPEEKKTTMEEIRKAPQEYIFTVVFGGARDIKKLKPPQGSIYILSSSEPVDEEREISFERLLNWLEHFGVAVYHIHSSGHATPLDIKEVIERAQPEIIIPVHTQYPLLFKNFVKVGQWEIPEGRGYKVVI